MPFDAANPAPSVQVSVSEAPLRASRLRPLSMGVFNYDGAWKVYSEFERVAVYPSRALAVSVAETRALDVLRSGRPVELFVQDEAGNLRQAPVTLG